MGAAPILNLIPAPPEAASAIPGYPQFTKCEVPPGSGAVAAYRGFIRPFSCNDNAKQVLRALEDQASLSVTEGRLEPAAFSERRHPQERLLVNMAQPCTVLVLEFDDSPHPRAFLLDPAMEPRISMPPHVRIDKAIAIGRKFLPALCVYSGSLFHFSGEENHLTEFLDQTATYLAKYLIWLRTRILLAGTRGESPNIRCGRPEELLGQLNVLLSTNLRWEGYWPGPSAPSGPVNHLATIRPDDECWCWSGKRYRNCCRRSDQAQARKQRG